MFLNGDGSCCFGYGVPLRLTAHSLEQLNGQLGAHVLEPLWLAFVSAKVESPVLWRLAEWDRHERSWGKSFWRDSRHASHGRCLNSRAASSPPPGSIRGFSTPPLGGTHSLRLFRDALFWYYDCPSKMVHPSKDRLSYQAQRTIQRNARIIF